MQIALLCLFMLKRVHQEIAQQSLEGYNTTVVNRLVNGCSVFLGAPLDVNQCVSWSLTVWISSDGIWKRVICSRARLLEASLQTTDLIGEFMSLFLLHLPGMMMMMMMMMMMLMNNIDIWIWILIWMMMMMMTNNIDIFWIWIWMTHLVVGI